MTFRADRRRRRPACQFEFLEPRSMLSAGLATAGAEVHALSKTHTVRGTVRGTITALSSNSLGSGTFLLVAVRPLAGFSSAILVQTASLSTQSRILTLSVSNGLAVANSSAGTLNLTYSGTGKFVSAERIAFSLSGTVTGGTGTFAGATGHMKATGQLNLTTSSSGTFLTTVALTYTV